jgi:UDP-glucose 4-epimerase
MILIVGAKSFIGTYLVDALLQLNEKIIVTGRDIENSEYFTSYENLIPINLDITKKEDFKKLLNFNIKTIIHLAGIMPANVDFRNYNPYEYMNVNIEGTLNILEFCRENKVKKIIYTSSEADISEQYNKYEIIDETVPRAINYNNDHTIYAITKIAAMDLIEHYHQKFGIIGIYFRLPNIFGYGQLLEHYKDGKLVLSGFGYFLKNSLNGSDIEVWGDYNKGRDIVYVKDLVQMIIKAINSDHALGLYCVGTGIKTTLLEQVKGIIEVFSRNGIKSKIIFKSSKPSVRSYLYDISKAKNDLSYKVEYPYLDLLKDWKKEFELDRFPHLRKRVEILK